MTPYGRRAEGPFRLLRYEAGDGHAAFRLSGFDRDFSLHVPGEHLALDATAAIALALSILRAERPESPKVEDVDVVFAALSAFAGSKRRSEILGEAGGVLFMDDYGHHPTAIRDTIRGVKEFWPRRRLIVDFMSHTYSRTAALFEDFVESLDDADIVVLHKIYPSARERPVEGLDGRALYDSLCRRRAGTGGSGAVPGKGGGHLYFDEPLDALEAVLSILRPGDLFLTMGAGDNWRLGAALRERLCASEKVGC